MQFHIEQSIVIDAIPEEIWQQIVDLDIASFNHPGCFRILGIPKPEKAVVSKKGLGGVRTAHFSGGNTFAQEITRWEPYENFGFTFHANKGFRVGHFLDLCDGPFQMKSGAYRLEPVSSNARSQRLYLSSDYQLSGFIGLCLGLPVRTVLFFFQRYLLKGIKMNLEQSDA